MKKKILVKAPALSQSGYGEQARFALRALRSREDLFEIYVLPIPWGRTGWVWEQDEFRQWLDQRITETQIQLQQKTLQVDYSLQVTIPNEFEKIAPINIGYTAGIETTQCSPQWLVKCNDMDKVLVVSNHAKSSIQDVTAEARNQETGETFPYKCERDIDVVWETTPQAAPEPIEGLELDYDNNFLFISQLSPRKNFLNTVTWFIEEFIDQEVGLVVKTNTANNSVSDYLRTEAQMNQILSQYPDRKCKIYLLHGDLSSGQMAGLYTNEKISALINISHGEGFGLPMFEAAREGLPIVTVGWSGQRDFLVKDGEELFQSVKFNLEPVQQEAVWPGVIEKESKWAFADQGSFKMSLRRVLKNKEEARRLAQLAKENIEESFSDDRLHKIFVDSVLGFDSALLEATEEEETVLEFE